MYLLICYTRYVSVLDLHRGGKMNETHNRLVEKVQTLSDLELALLVCLVAEQHCILQTETQLLQSIEEELKLVCDCWEWISSY